MSNNKKFDVKDMALEDEKKVEKPPDMSLESPSHSEIEARIKEAFPDKNIIKIDDSSSLMRMATGNYRLDDTSLDDLPAKDLNRIDIFLKENK